MQHTFGYSYRLLTSLMVTMIGVCNSYEVILEDRFGASYLLQVDPNTPFKDVLFDIQSRFVEIECMQINVQGLTLSLPQSESVIKASKNTHWRDYFMPVTPQEKSDIHYIVKTLGECSLHKIPGHESALTKAGDRIKQVHPLKFLTCVFTDEELKVSMRNLKGRAFVWKKFIDGLVKSLEEEHSKGNLMDFIPEFARIVQIESNLITPSLQQGKWKEFIVVLIDKVPRLGNTGRYNM